MNVKKQRQRERKQEKRRSRRKAEARREQYDPNDIRLVAAHEAGHAVTALAFGFSLESVSVRWHQNPGGIAPAGYTHARLPVPYDIEGRGAEAALPLMVQMMSGPAAEAQAAPNFKLERVCHNPRGREDASATAAVALSSLDQAPVAMEAERDATDALVAECVALCNRAKAEATRFVAANRAAIGAVAAALIRKASLSGDEVAALVAAAKR